MKSATILAGSAGGMAVALMLMPVVTRLFDTATYGVFATIAAIVSTLVGASTLRFEVVAVSISDRAHSDAVAAAGMWTSLLVGLITLLVCLSLILTAILPWTWIAVGPLVVLAAAQYVASARLSRDHRARALGASSFAQSVLMPAVQVVGGFITSTVGVLLAGFGIARVVWFGSLPRVGPARAFRSIDPSLRRYGVTAGSSAAVNSLAGQVPVLAAAALYSTGAAAIVAMTFRLLVTPLTLIGQAVANAALGEIAKELHEPMGNARLLVVKGMRDLFLVGLIPCGLAALIGPRVAGWLLGDEWAQTGLAIAALAPGALAQLAAAPFSQILNLTRHNAELLAWDVARLVLIVTALAVPAALGGPLIAGLVTVSAVQVVLYAALGFLCMRAVEHPAPGWDGSWSGTA